MADDVFVLVTPDLDSKIGPGLIKNIQGVVLASKKVLGNRKKILQMQVDDAQDSWLQDGNSGDVPIEELYRYLERMNMSAYHAGRILPIDEAKELIKNNGGL